MRVRFVVGAWHGLAQSKFVPRVNPPILLPQKLQRGKNRNFAVSSPPSGERILSAPADSKLCLCATNSVCATKTTCSARLVSSEVENQEKPQKQFEFILCRNICCARYRIVGRRICFARLFFDILARCTTEFILKTACVIGWRGKSCGISDFAD